MKFTTELKKWRTQKKSVKITLLVELNDIPESLYKFEDMPLNVTLNNIRIDGEVKNIEQLASGSINIILYAGSEYKQDLIQYGPQLKKIKKFQTEFLIDADEQIKRMNQINGDQRAKAYATIRDISESLGYELTEAKRIIKDKFLEIFPYDDISLADCSKKAASDFIDFSIRLGYEMGVQWDEHPRLRMDSLERWLRLCLDQKICAVCSKPGRLYLLDDSNIIVHEHHVKAVAMGNNRYKIDDSKYPKISLCAVHHTESHTIGWKEFRKRYHVKGIVYNGRGGEWR